MLAFLVENDPVWMFLRYLGNDVFVGLPFPLAILDSQRQPPQLRENSLLVEIVHHLLDRIPRKRVGSRIPITVAVKPAVIQRSPLDAEFLQLWHSAQHLFRPDIELVSPSAPTHVVRFARWLRNLPPFFLQNA